MGLQVPDLKLRIPGFAIAAAGSNQSKTQTDQKVGKLSLHNMIEHPEALNALERFL